ncbi:MAG TPA: (d)CMP kinase [Segeticoccus sp.]|nr:(d)CMP kinase [Segeticoccus sp.]
MEGTDQAGRRDRFPDGTVARLAGCARDRTAGCGSTVVVAVDGPSGSGKTTLGRQLAATLGATLVHMDDLYQGWDGLAESPHLLEQHLLGPLSRGERAAYRRFDWDRGEPAGWRAVSPTAFLVVEGVGAGARPAGQHVSLLVWLEADRRVRRARGLERDGDAYTPHWERWAAQERELFARDRTRERADVVIDTTTDDAQVEWRSGPARPS